MQAAHFVLRFPPRVPGNSHIGITGSLPQLGLWHNPVQLNKVGNGWRAIILLPQGQPFQFKFVIVDGAGAITRWEHGENRAHVGVMDNHPIQSTWAKSLGERIVDGVQGGVAGGVAGGAAGLALTAAAPFIVSLTPIAVPALLTVKVGTFLAGVAGTCSGAAAGVRAANPLLEGLQEGALAGAAVAAAPVVQAVAPASAVRALGTGLHR
jgi:hypothetical protein